MYGSDVVLHFFSWLTAHWTLDNWIVLQHKTPGFQRIAWPVLDILYIWHFVLENPSVDVAVETKDLLDNING